MPTTGPQVSILIPCYNAEQWIGAAIESALAQAYPHCEVVVVDDGSRDGSAQVVRGFGDRVRFVSRENKGGNPTRNELLAAARGDWIQYLDADDYLLPDKIARQVAFVEGHPDVDVVYGSVTYRWEPEGRMELRQLPEDGDPWTLLISWSLPQTGSPLWRKSALLDVGGWNNKQPCCQEHELYLRLLKAGKRFAYCGGNGAVYRQWSDATVCKVNVPLVHEKQMEIVDAAESWLKDNDALSSGRAAALDQIRFDTARSAWRYDPARARAIESRVRPGFAPAGPTAPRSFRMIRSVFGFAAAEQFADMTRTVRKKLS